jgi:glycosyltransferase involved in cell wall biosynthesis
MPHENNGRSGQMKIGFDAKRAFYNKSGLGNYSRNLLNTFAEYHPENSYFLFTPSTEARLHLEKEELFRIIEPSATIDRFLRPLWRLKTMNKEIKKHGLDIFHGLSHELPIGIEKSGARSVVTVHDLIFLRYPKFYNPFDVRIYTWKLIHACRAASHIVAISNQTRTDLINFLKIDPGKISVIYQGCNPQFRKRYEADAIKILKKKYNLPERYLLYVGTIEQRKNLLGVLKAMHLCNAGIPLVVIGKKKDKYFTEVQNYINSSNLRNIFFPEGVTNSELPGIYQNAECFIYPSFFEGFGIPVVEALVSGTPVITSKGGCLEEAGGPGSIYINPESPEQIGEAICSVINSKEKQEEMTIKGLEYSGNFDDRVIADAYISLYNSLLK